MSETVGSNDLELPVHLALPGIFVICNMKREIYMVFTGGLGRAPAKDPPLRGDDTPHASTDRHRNEAVRLMANKPPSKPTSVRYRRFRSKS
jgi:hypothetical protein